MYTRPFTLLSLVIVLSLFASLAGTPRLAHGQPAPATLAASSLPATVSLPQSIAAFSQPPASMPQAIAVKIAAGGSHTCALTSGGGGKCWGANSSGQLGDSTTAPRSTPGDVAGLTGGVAAIAAGGSHTCALTNSGGVKCWGNNYFGQLGDGTTTHRNAPVDVAGLTSGVVVITAGRSHTCALTSGGGTKCWGANGAGQLGDDTTTDRRTPVDVAGLTSGVAAIAAGGDHTCALTNSGGAKCWGHNWEGQLGDGAWNSRRTPGDVVGLTSGVAAIAAGGDHTCALTNSGGAKCWGDNEYGQLGDGATDDRSIPGDVTGLTSGVAAIAAGGNHTCALTDSGGARCWGLNQYGQLGDGTTAWRVAPVDVTGLTGDIAAITGGGIHTCAQTSDGRVKCWGANEYGQLGDGTAWRFAPGDVAGLTSGVAAIAAGGTHTCAATSGGGAKCWGWNGYGELGDGTMTLRIAPVDVVGLTSGVTAIAGGGIHTCAAISGGGTKCWGNNLYGQLGDGTWGSRRTPVDVMGLTDSGAALTAGGAYTCALTNSGGGKCWGANGAGQLGDDTTTDRLTPVDVAGLTSGVVAITAGGAHTCALTSAGGAKCWGANEYGQLGDGTGDPRSTPGDVTWLTSGVTAIAAGGDHTCAVTNSGGVKCWGRNDSGQLGNGKTSGFGTPVPIDVTGLTGGVTAIAAGGDHTCVLTSSGGGKCWGENGAGQLGDGTTTDRSTPVDVAGLTSGVAAITAGGWHTCALTSAGGAKCWGKNESGQLGDGAAWRTTPVDVVWFGDEHTLYLPLVLKSP